MISHSNDKLDDLFFDAWQVVTTTCFFLYIFISKRGVGKTYSMLRGLVFGDKPFIYMRRTETELDNCCDERNNPFKRINLDYNLDIRMIKTRSMYTIVRVEHEKKIVQKADKETGKMIDEEVDVETEHFIGYGAAMSTCGKLRGMDLSDVDFILYDEFICTTLRPTFKGNEEMGLLGNLLETVSRNRELLGQAPIKIVCCANSNSLDNGILTGFKLVDTIRIMKQKKIETYTDEKRGIYLGLPIKKGYTELKRNTAVYRLFEGTEFSEMALDNNFVGENFDVVRKIPTNKLTPLFSYEHAYFYEIKDSDKIYVTTRKAKCEHYREKNLKSFKIQYGLMFETFLENDLFIYSNYDLKIFVQNIF